MPLTIKDLKEILSKYDDDTLVLTSSDNDYCLLEVSDLIYKNKAGIKFYPPHQAVDCHDEYIEGQNLTKKNVIIIKAD